jgi:hypothetical protein
MNTPMYLYSVMRKDVAPSAIASMRSAAFCTIWGDEREEEGVVRREAAAARNGRGSRLCARPTWAR